tara:strand:+ start:5595 stop:6359 length:765 start_codon:yes stop_codon:yes gene_type:complete
MNRIKKKLKQSEDILSIYFTVGFPCLNDTLQIIKELDSSKVDMIELGLPFSDPLADGQTIQNSSKIALANGMSTQLLFEQLIDIRNHTDIPLIIMGYFNPIFQYGIDLFCKKCKEVGIDGLIIPDLPPEIYISDYKKFFQHNDLINILLITPQTSDNRIKFIDSISDGFIYMVSSSSITGGENNFTKENIDYFKRIKNLKLKSPKIIGFGISNREIFLTANNYANGCIIGSAFIKYIQKNGISSIRSFVEGITS